MATTYRGTTAVHIEHPDQDLSFRSLANAGEVAAKLEDMINGVASGAVYPSTSAYVEQGGVRASTTITLGGSAGDIIVIVGNTGTPPETAEVPAGANNTATAAAVAAAMNAVPAIAALVTAESSGAVVTVTARWPGTIYNELIVSTVVGAGTATVANSGYLVGGTEPTGRYLGRKGGTV